MIVGDKTKASHVRHASAATLPPMAVHGVSGDYGLLPEHENINL